MKRISTLARVPAAGALPAPALALALALLAGCGSAAPEPPPAPSPHAGEVRLTPEQRRNIRTERVAVLPFRRTVAATGTVAFDQNRST
ncbi:MAG TPA: hypothetical protein VJA16_10750, partial [Thermoanaerobaculia bacterium]